MLVSLAIMLLAVKTQVSDWCVSIRVLLVKFVGEYSLLCHRFSGVCSKLVNQLSRVSRL